MTELDFQHCFFDDVPNDIFLTRDDNDDNVDDKDDEMMMLITRTISSSLRQFCLTTDFVSYLVGFLIQASPYFQNCFRFPICRYRNHVCKILTVSDPFIEKKLKMFQNVVFDSLN